MPAEAFSRDEIRELRALIRTRPDLVLDDPEVVLALAEATRADLGDNVVDMRSAAINVLREKVADLDKLHRQVIMTSFDNHSGTRRVHRAVLVMLRSTDLTTLLESLNRDIVEILRLDAIRLVASTPMPEWTGRKLLAADSVAFRSVSELLSFTGEPGISAPNPVILRRVEKDICEIYGHLGTVIQSEALVSLDPGQAGIRACSLESQLLDKDPPSLTGRKLPDRWILVLGSRSPQYFEPGMATDLLSFLGEAFMRIVGRWLR